MGSALAVGRQRVAQVTTPPSMPCSSRFIRQRRCVSGTSSDADEGVVALEVRLLSRQVEEVVGVVLDVAVGGDRKPAVPAAGSCIVSPACGCISAHDAVDQRARREVLPGAGLLARRRSSPAGLRRGCRALPRGAENQSSWSMLLISAFRLVGLRRLGLRVGEDRADEQPDRVLAEQVEQQCACSSRAGPEPLCAQRGQRGPAGSLCSARMLARAWFSSSILRNSR